MHHSLLFTSLKESKKITLLVIWIFFSLILFIFASAKHLLLGSSAWDLGIFEQFSWLIANKGINSISSLRGVAPLEDHFSLLLIPIALIYKVIPYTLTLLGLQAFALGSIPSLGIYLFSGNKHITKIEIALIVSLILSPVIFLANIANFHPEVVSAPFMLLTISELKKKDVKPYYMSLIVCLCAKKSQVLFGAGLSLYGFAKGKFKKGIITLIISLLWWFNAEHFTAIGGNYIQDRLGYLGNSLTEICLTLITKPWTIFKEAPPEAIFLYTLGLLLPFIGLLKKKSIPALISISPIYFLNIISSAGTQRELYSQYSIAILPFLIATFWDSFEPFNTISKTEIKWRSQLTVFLSIIAFIGYSRIGYFNSRYFPKINEAIALQATKSSIPITSSILTTDNMAPHFANRETIKTIANNDFYPLSQYDYILLPINKERNKNLNNNLVVKIRLEGMQCSEQNKYYMICSK